MKIFPKLAMFAAALLLLSGCGGTSALKAPEKAGKDEKVKIYVVSHTPEKFAGMKDYQAIWNGVAPLVIKYNRIMQCDMTPETVLTLRDMGFEIVGSPEEADYRLDTAVEACGKYTFPSGSKLNMSLYNNRTEVPLKQKALYRDFKQWVDSGKAGYYYKEILELFDRNPDAAMRQFANVTGLRELRAMSDEGSWSKVIDNGANYQIAATKEHLLFPEKFRGVSDEQKAFLRKWMAITYTDENAYRGNYGTSGAVGFANVGSSLSSAGHGGAGAAVAAVGVAQVLFGKSPPMSAMSYRLTRLSDGRSVRVDGAFNLLLDCDFGSPFVHNTKDEVENALDELFDKMNDI